MRTPILTLLLFVCTLLAPAPPIYYLATGQTGAQTQIDVDHTSTWTFTPNANFMFGGGLFTMKDGNNTTDTLTLSLYEGTNSSGPTLGSVTVTRTQFCSQVSNCGQFAYHQLFFVSPVAVLPGTTYFAALTSTAPDVQSKAYFIKDQQYFASDINGNPIAPPPIGDLALAPEPATGSVGLIGLAAVGIGLARRKRRSTCAVVQAAP